MVISEQKAEQIIELLNQGYPVSKVAKQLKVSRNTVYGIAKRYNSIQPTEQQITEPSLSYEDEELIYMKHELQLLKLELEIKKVKEELRKFEQVKVEDPLFKQIDELVNLQFTMMMFKNFGGRNAF